MDLTKINMDIYLPNSVNPQELVAIPNGGTLISDDVNNALLAEMQIVASEDMSEEQVDCLIDNMSKKRVLPWELYNKLLGYVCPHHKKSFRELFDSLISKHYVDFFEIDRALASMEAPFKPIS